MSKLKLSGRDPKLIRPDDPEFKAFVEGGIPIERLSKRLLPKLGVGDYDAETAVHDGWGDFSREGFMGVDDDPLIFIHADLMTVLSHDLTPQMVADRVKLSYEDDSHLHPDYEFMGVTTDTIGSQSCPWECPDIIGVDDGIIYRKNLLTRPGGSLYLALAMTSKLNEEGMAKWIKDSSLQFGPDHEYTTKARQDVEAIQALLASGEVYTARVTSMLAHEIEAHCLFGGGPGSPYRADPEFLINALNLRKHA